MKSAARNSKTLSSCFYQQSICFAVQTYTNQSTKHLNPLKP